MEAMTACKEIRNYFNRVRRYIWTQKLKTWEGRLVYKITLIMFLELHGKEG